MLIIKTAEDRERCTSCYGNIIVELTIQALADHFNVDRAKVNLTVKIRTEGYGPTEHQFPEVSAVIKEG